MATPTLVPPGTDMRLASTIIWALPRPFFSAPAASILMVRASTFHSRISASLLNSSLTGPNSISTPPAK